MSEKKSKERPDLDTRLAEIEARLSRLERVTPEFRQLSLAAVRVLITEDRTVQLEVLESWSHKVFGTYHAGQVFRADHVVDVARCVEHGLRVATPIDLSGESVADVVAKIRANRELADEEARVVRVRAAKEALASAAGEAPSDAS